MSDPDDIQREKTVLRRAIRNERPSGRDCRALIAAILLGVDFSECVVVAGIWPLAGEPDLRPLWHALYHRGCRMVLPETTRKGEALAFRPWQPDCAMLEGRFGTWHPTSERLAAGVNPDLIFVPLLAFDQDGFRLGYGGGYYDRTLAGLPHARAVGVGFASQQVERLPRGPFDIKLPLIVTENGPLAFFGKD